MHSEKSLWRVCACVRGGGGIGYLEVGRSCAGGECDAIRSRSTPRISGGEAAAAGSCSTPIQASGASVHFTGLGARAPAKCPNAWIRAQLRVDSILPFHLLALITTRLDGITSLFARSSRTATHPACNLVPPPWSASPPRTTSSSPSTAMSPSDPCSSSRCSKVSQSPRAR